MINLLDYCITTGEKQGNSKHFQNFLKIHSHILKIEKDNEHAKHLLTDKTNKLIKMEQNERQLKAQISGLEIEVLKLKRLTDQQELKIDNLMDAKINGF